MTSPRTPVEPQLHTQQAHTIWQTILAYIQAHFLVLSWLLWMLSVMLFMIWTKATYHAVARPLWLGMTIRSSVFALWMLVLREWAVIRFYKD